MHALPSLPPSFRLALSVCVILAPAALAQTAAPANSVSPPPTIGTAPNGAVVSLTQNTTGNLTGKTMTANTTVADHDWLSLQQLVKSSSQPGADNRAKTAPQRLQEKITRVQQARSVAQTARDFYMKHPTSARVRVARKLEAISALNGVDDDDRTQEVSALKVANDYRADKFNHPRDRFEVASLAERVGTRAWRGGELVARKADDDVKIADRLRAEFGDLPEVFRFYAMVARGADMKTAVRLASMIVTSGAPNDAKAEAAAILSRQLLVGRRLTSSVTSSTGPAINLEKLSGAPTIICAWSAAHPETLNALAKLPSGLLKDVRVLYFAPGAEAAQLKALKVSPAVPGTLCFQSSTAKRRLVDELRVQQLPYIFVLDRTGIVVGYGPPDQAAALLAQVRR